MGRVRASMSVCFVYGPGLPTSLQKPDATPSKRPRYRAASGPASVPLGLVRSTLSPPEVILCSVDHTRSTSPGADRSAFRPVFLSGRDTTFPCCATAACTQRSGARSCTAAPRLGGPVSARGGAVGTGRLAGAGSQRGQGAEGGEYAGSRRSTGAGAPREHGIGGWHVRKLRLNDQARAILARLSGDYGIPELSEPARSDTVSLRRSASRLRRAATESPPRMPEEDTADGPSAPCREIARNGTRVRNRNLSSRRSPRPSGPLPSRARDGPPDDRDPPDS